MRLRNRRHSRLSDSDDNDEDDAPAPKRGRRSRGGAGPSGRQRTPGPANGRAGNAAEPCELDAEETEHIEDLTENYRQKADATREKLQVSEQEADQLVARVMRFMLFRQGQRPDQPVRRDEIAKFALGTRAAAHLRYQALPIIQLAQAKFPEILGLEMKELDLHPAGSRKGNIKGSFNVQAGYILRSLLPGALRRRACPEPAPLCALAMVALAVIHLSGGVVGEEALWQHLAGLGLQRGEQHEAFAAKPQDQLELLIKQRYLAEARRGQGVEAERTFVRGDNAASELSDEQLAEFIKQVFEAPQQPLVA